MTKPSIYTIGHSTHPFKEFVQLLKKYRIEKLVDVRVLPYSKHNSQFNKENLAKSLLKYRIQYIHMPGLGGHRRAEKNSPNSGWKNASFRGYADYMQTEAFEENLRELITLAKKNSTVIMCAEAVPWQCHRSLIADSLTLHGLEVKNIIDMMHEFPHQLNAMIKIKKGKIYYPAQNLFSEV